MDILNSLIARAACAAVLMLLPAAAGARDNLVAEAVQMPAWVMHGNGAFRPLAPGDVLQNKDTVRTGPGARVLLRLAEGSTIKLARTPRWRWTTWRSSPPPPAARASWSPPAWTCWRAHSASPPRRFSSTAASATSRYTW